MQVSEIGDLTEREERTDTNNDDVDPGSIGC